ncbi:MAG: tRNA pseudouridine(38-40) synthase TruA [Candidatus Obscuribacterales bacterium]
MPRIALKVEYRGNSFHGSQYQVGVSTVQSELEGALTTLARQEIRVHFSGRTDTGVHARGQVAHIEWPDKESPDIEALSWSLNGILSKNMAVVAAQEVDDSFHARFTALEREYVYRILNRRQRSPLLKDTHYFVRQDLDLKAMQDAALRLMGRHDFSSFRSTNADKSSPVCTVTRAQILNLGEGQLEFWIAADHFVYNMVRIIVGTLIEIGLGKKEPAAMSDALEECDRNLAGPTAPPWGLTLNSVHYPEHYHLFQKTF